MVTVKPYAGLSLGDLAGRFIPECMPLPVLRQYSGLLRVLTTLSTTSLRSPCTHALSTLIKGGSCPPSVSLLLFLPSRG